MKNSEGQFLIHILREVGVQCEVSTILDEKYIEDRIKHEGFSFLTITLPAFCDGFQRSLAAGRVDSSHFLGFPRKGGLPKFLWGFLRRVFDSRSGVLLDEPSVSCIWAVRQVTLFLGKIKLPCTPARERKAFAKFVECESAVQAAELSWSSDILEDFDRIRNLLFGEMLSRVSKEIYDGNLYPRHGGGATAERLTGSEKYNLAYWPKRLEEVFSYADYALPSYRYWQDIPSELDSEPGTEIPVRVISVPKTLKTPRIIAIEPTCMQFMQQALLRVIATELERDRLLYNFVSLDDQVPNQVLACKGSRDGSYATLDLSEASDRVSNLLVERFYGSGCLGEAVQATRSRLADVPGFGVLKLRKFASMGSALTFPTEAMVFLTIVFVGMEKRSTRRFTREDVKRFAGEVRIYGDDIIIPTDYASDVRAALEAFGLVVSPTKSFWTGGFRESCGKEYVFGEDVSIVRCRREFPANIKDVEGVASSVSLANQLYMAGLWQTSELVFSRLRKLGIPLPVVESTSAALGKHSFQSFYQTDRTCDRLHRPLVKALVVKPVPVRRETQGWQALHKFFSERGDEPLPEDHLIHSGRPSRLALKRGWYTPF